MVYPEALRWLVVWKAWFMGMSHAKVRRHLDGGSASPPPSASTIRRIVKHFRATGNVKTESGRRREPGAEQIEFSRPLSKALIECVLDSPEDPLEAIAENFGAQTGVQRSTATICRALHKLGYTRKRLRAFSRRRNEAAAKAFLADVLRHGHGLDPVRAWRAIMRVGEGLVHAGHAHLAEQLYQVAACQPIATTGFVRELGGFAHPGLY